MFPLFFSYVSKERMFEKGHTKLPNATPTPTSFRQTDRQDLSGYNSLAGGGGGEEEVVPDTCDEVVGSEGHRLYFRRLN